jgi:hypothetical protein
MMNRRKRKGKGRKKKKEKEKKRKLKKMTISHLMCHVFPLSQSIDVSLSPNLHPILLL